MMGLAARACGAALVLLLLMRASPVDAGEGACPTPASMLSIKPALPYLAAKIARREKLTILAMGSSSTEGVGASSPAATYPSRLEAELRKRFPNIDIRVINRGRSGEDAPEEVVRLERDVVADDPDLVIWQIGTNAALRGLDPDIERAMLRRGIALIKESAADIVLMDLQYAPRVLAAPAHATMQKLIAEVAERNRVGLFRRFEIMRHWLSAAPADLAPSGAAPGGAGSAISADGLHMTDRSYACLAAGLADAIAQNWEQSQAERSPAARLANLPGAADSEAGEEP
jgi:lysophospholipase L1-like esterase